jgi:hypothetical protein
MSLSLDVAVSPAGSSVVRFNLRDDLGYKSVDRRGRKFALSEEAKALP